jgi:SHS2 domain-containing protein
LTGAVDARSWKHFEHEADIGLAATSGSREGLFEGMGAALTAVITDPANVRPRQRIRIRCSAPDNALLMVDWINALIYEMATRGMLFGSWQVGLQGCNLDAWVEGEPVERDRHQPAVEVKGATYTELRVEKDATGVWRAQCVVDV